MGEVERHELAWWGEKIVGDPDLMPMDANGKRPGDKDYGTEPVESYCNLAVHRICRGMKYEAFSGMLANQIIDHMELKWIKTSGSDPDRANSAQVAANIGDLAVAGLGGRKHGHVAVIAPGNKVFSGRWNCYLPRCYNVGMRNGIMGCNYAFKEIPEFYILGRVTA